MDLFHRFSCEGLKTVVVPRRPSDAVLLPVVSATTMPVETKQFEKMVLNLATIRDEEATRDLQHEAVLHSPIAQLPPEILGCVFEFYVDAGDELTPVAISPQGPFCLAQVCKLWRAITESHPRLWTSVHFYFPANCKYRERYTQSVQLVLDWHLKRSGALPMSFTFADHRTYSTHTRNLVCLLVDRLRRHSSRWKRISLHLSRGYFPLLSTFTPCDLSSLEHLHLSSNVLEPFIAPCLDLESATNLKSLAYNGSSHSLGGTVNVLWEQLEKVSLDFGLDHGTGFPSPQQFTDLYRCQNMTTCSLGIDIASALNGGQPVILPHLRTLRVRRLSSRSDAGTLDDLILPKLDTLDIDAPFLIWNDAVSPWHDHHFSNLLARSGRALHHLSIRDVDFPSDEVVRCLALSPSLTSLRFLPYPRSQDVSDVIRALDVSHALGDHQGHAEAAVRENDGPLVPDLRELMLGTSHEGSLDAMMTMFYSRGGARTHADEVATLGRVQVVFFHFPHCPGEPLQRVASFQRELAQWASESEEWHQGERVETEVVVDAPYLVEYINVD